MNHVFYKLPKELAEGMNLPLVVRCRDPIHFRSNTGINDVTKCEYSWMLLNDDTVFTLHGTLPSREQLTFDILSAVNL